MIAMDEAAYRVELRRLIEEKFAGKKSRAAAAWQFDRSTLYLVLDGRKPPPPKLLAATGHRWAIIRSV